MDSGPFSRNNPSSDEAPGPPLSQITSGVLSISSRCSPAGALGLQVWLSKNQRTWSSGG
jgi:hypothetical protein